MGLVWSVDTTVLFVIGKSFCQELDSILSLHIFTKLGFKMTSSLNSSNGYVIYRWSGMFKFYSGRRNAVLK